MKYIKLLGAELLKIWGDVKGYWFNYIFGNLNVFFLFLGIFYAFSNRGNTNNSVFYFLFGLMLWYYGVHAIDLVAIIIEEEVTEGTLEQVFLTKTNLIKVLFFRILSQVIFDTVKGIVVFALCVMTFKLPVSFLKEIRWLPTLFIFFLTLAGLYGIGYIVAGLSIIYKRATAVAAAASNLLLFFSGIIIPVEQLPEVFIILAKILPLHWGMKSLTLLIESNFSMLKIIGNSNFHLLVTISLLWIVIGVFIFEFCKQKACIRGSLAQY